MATDLGCPVWYRGTRGLLVNGDKHVRALVAGSIPAIPTVSKYTLQGNALEESTPERGWSIRPYFAHIAPHPPWYPSTHKAWVRGLSPDQLCYNSLI